MGERLLHIVDPRKDEKVLLRRDTHCTVGIICVPVPGTNAAHYLVAHVHEGVTDTEAKSPRKPWDYRLFYNADSAKSHAADLLGLEGPDELVALHSKSNDLEKKRIHSLFEEKHMYSIKEIIKEAFKPMRNN